MTQSLDRVGNSVEKVLQDAVVDDRESGVTRPRHAAQGQGPRRRRLSRHLRHRRLWGVSATECGFFGIWICATGTFATVSITEATMRS